MIKGVLFDYSGVVAYGGRGKDIAKRLCQDFGLEEGLVEQVVYPLLQEMTLGRLETSAFWESLSKQTDRHFNEQEKHVWDDWWDVDVYPEMLKLINDLRSQNYQIGLLSNVIPPILERIKAGGGYSHFDFSVLSCELGVAKPDPKMYELAMRHFNGLKPEEVVFIDDQDRCLPPAEELGMHTILATSSEQIIAELRKLDLPV
jgi:epoxide hydrolase-like predicted phosphatase